MGEIGTIGLDRAKSVFQMHAVDEAGRLGLRRQIKRAQLLTVFAGLSPCLVGMEACSGKQSPGLFAGPPPPLQPPGSAR